jgi:hypothetical protein
MRFYAPGRWDLCPIRSGCPASAGVRGKGHSEYGPTVAAAVGQLALMRAHDCLLYEAKGDAMAGFACGPAD